MKLKNVFYFFIGVVMVGGIFACEKEEMRDLEPLNDKEFFSEDGYDLGFDDGYDYGN